MVSRVFFMKLYKSLNIYIFLTVGGKPTEPHLVLAVVVLRVSEDSVGESEHVLVRSVLLVSQLLQTQQRTLPSRTILKGGLQDPEDLIRTHKHTVRELEVLQYFMNWSSSVCECF